MTSSSLISFSINYTLCGVVASTLAHADPATSYTKEIIPLLENHCYQCHSDGETKEKFALDGFKDLPTHLNDRKYGITVWRSLRSQVMPPSDNYQPNLAQRKQLLAWIERDVF